MQEHSDAMKLVKAELCERLAILQAKPRRKATHDFANSVNGIRRLAAAYGMAPVARLAQALERAIAEESPRPGAGCPIALYLDRLQDAICCGRCDDEAGEAMIASVSVRLSG